MLEDDETAGEMEEFLDDTLIREFANDQDLTLEWRIEDCEGGSRCTIALDGAAMPAVAAVSDQLALDRASVRAIELLTRGERANEPELVFA